MKTNSSIEKKKEMVYKRVKALMPHCKDCGEELFGNNSVALPYRCSCGTWEQNWSTGEFYIKIK